MTEPDFSHGFLRVPLAVWLEVFCRAPFTRRQLQLVAVVIRESWGWQTPARQVHLWTRPMTVAQFAMATGLTTDHLRRDLDQLVRRGVLRESRCRYQFVPDPALWIMAPPPRNLRPQALKPPAPSAAFALPDLASKKRDRKPRNVSLSSETKLSTGGDNSSSRSSPARRAGTESSAPAVARLVTIIAAFVGSLSPSQITGLQCWIEQAGVAAVWATLEPVLRNGEAAGRKHLETSLANWGRG